MSAGDSFLSDPRKNLTAIAVYTAVLFAISPLLGANWISPGDFDSSTQAVYHALMIPLTLLLAILACELLGLPRWAKLLANYATYPTLALTFVGNAILQNYYPSSLANYAVQGVRDVLLYLVALAVIVAALLKAARERAWLKAYWAPFLLILAAGVSIALAPIYGIVSLMPQTWHLSFLASTVNAVGNQTFVSDLVTSHSHQMLPAVGDAIVGLTAIWFGYSELRGRARAAAAAGLIIGLASVIVFTYLYWASGVGTYSIPTIAPFGPQGVNGLALDDFTTGLSGWGAMLVLAALYVGPLAYLARSGQNAERLYRLATLATWVAAMAILVGIGYFIEFNEAFFGFGSPGQPPSGGPGYMFDDAFMKGHLVTAFMIIPLLAATMLAVDYIVKEGGKAKRYLAYLTFASLLLCYLGVQFYTMTLIPTLLEAALAVSGLDLLLNALAPLYVRPRTAS
ncbi:hypothetical protein [Acidilobus saccharovorans]|uniref:hypothetical protein n=1 Tax=Acidilobus saccharovorans TaxID=242703 RepID=UPI000AFE1C9F|nr:hypothetical protein [Acidilobus saccharovorans]